jgi:hypothetical protein
MFGLSALELHCRRGPRKAALEKIDDLPPPPIIKQNNGFRKLDPSPATRGSGKCIHFPSFRSKTAATFGGGGSRTGTQNSSSAQSR